MPRLHPPLLVLLVLFVFLGALYSVTTPIFEAGDELWHYPHVWWIARGNGLPVQDPAQKQLWEQEGGQPPLYYALAAAATFWIPTDDLPERLWRNPYARIGVPLAFGNKNMIVHTPAENFPWQGTVLAVHLVRLLSVLFSTGTVYLTYRLATTVTAPSSVEQHSTLALAAAAIVAFNPMFLFISASVNNDSLAALTATAALVLVVQLATRGVSTRRLLALGAACGLALLTKVSNLAVILVAMIVLAWLAGRARDWRILLKGGGLVLAPTALLAGWWFVRNYQIYGDPLAFNVWLQIAGGRPPQTLLGLLGEFQGFRISFWGNFGGVNLIAPEWVYALLDLFSLLALFGLIIGAIAALRLHTASRANGELSSRLKGETPVRPSSSVPRPLSRVHLPPLSWILALAVLVVFAALVRWTWLTYASQGRLMFPAIASIAILMTYGLGNFGAFALELARPFYRRASCLLPSAYLVLPIILCLVLFAFSAAAPFLLIAPAYAPPPRLAARAVVPNPVHLRFDADGAQPELVGYEAARAATNGELPLTLFWRTGTPISEDLALYIHVYDAAGNLLGQWDALPGNGLAPTRFWQPGEILVDSYRVPVASPRAPPPIGRIEVGLVRVGTTRPLGARNPEGQEITPTLGTFKFAQTPAPPAAARAVFGEQFRLVDLALETRRSPLTLHPGDRLAVTATLQAIRVPDAAYTLFAHLVDASGNIIAQDDAQPFDGAYPTTLWDANEVVTDSLTLQLPPDLPVGTYALEFGIYRAADIQRLPVTGSAWDIWQVQGDHLGARQVEVEP